MSRKQDEPSEYYLSALSEIVSGGLFVEEDENDVPGKPERALLHVTGALLKAVTVATFTDGDGEENFGPLGWVASSSRLSRAEQHSALCGIVALLQGGSRVLEELRHKEEFRGSGERVVDEAAARERRHARAGGAS